MMGECVKCKEKITISDIRITCSNCENGYHQRCTGLTRAMAGWVSDTPALLFKCADCLEGAAVSNMMPKDDVLSLISNMKKEMEKFKSITDSFAAVRESIEAHINIAIESGIDRLIRSSNDALESKMACLENSVAKKLEDLKSFVIKNNQRNDNELVIMKRKKIVADRKTHSESDGNPRRKRKIMSNTDDEPHDKNIDNDSNDEVFDKSNKKSYADVLSGKLARNRTKSNRNRKTRSVIMIKPIESSQTSDDTRQFLKGRLDPRTHKISNFKNGKDGSIIVECAAGEDIQSVKENIESNLGTEYNAVIPKPGKPKLKIVGMSDRYSSDVFIDLLKSQNQEISIEDVKVVADFENPRFKYNKFSVII
ncbi:uncharacterized protein LOC131432692 [Malaya genurostris]|uniref:uncharacterized protein LOC131432692 n=1 Tax=Malaya genurostris TaxID=325434 RepID=UPI0026F39033|nr:uncharacterized protein LOC131432692 [Malaya genurostris]